jgi:hypothetical protein
MSSHMNVPIQLDAATDKMNSGILIFNIAVFVAAIFLLDSEADIFIDHTAIVTSRLSVSQPCRVVSVDLRVGTAVEVDGQYVSDDREELCLRGWGLPRQRVGLAG